MCVLERGDGSVLLVRHPYRSRWGLPGGLLKRGEAPPDGGGARGARGGRRPIVVVGEPAVVVDPDPRRVDVVFRARLDDPADADRVRPCSPEIVEVRWFPPTTSPSCSSRPPAPSPPCAARDAHCPRRWKAGSLPGPGRIAQLARAPPLQGGSRGFETLCAHHQLASASTRSSWRRTARPASCRCASRPSADAARAPTCRSGSGSRSSWSPPTRGRGGSCSAGPERLPA